MATVDISVRHLKANGTGMLEIHIIHKRQHAYLKTSTVVTKSDLITGKLKLKKTFYNEPIEKRLNTLRRYISAIENVDSYSVHELRDYLEQQELTKGGTYIDFIAFCLEANELIKEEKGENGTYKCNSTAITWLQKFERSEASTKVRVGELERPVELAISKIKKEYLESFERYMRRNGVGDAGVNCYFRAIRTLFLAAMDRYNDEANDYYPIKHYPFKRFKIKDYVPDKRSTEVDVVKLIKNATPETLREALGRDMFLLTFCFAGIAPIDLYLLQEPTNGYIEYYRDKVKNRIGKVKVRIKVGDEAQAIIDRYSASGFLSEVKRYASEKEFSAACRKGLKSLLGRLRVEDNKTIITSTVADKISLYWARHTFSTIAGILEFDTNLIDFVLGHKPKNAKMAEVYITRTQESVDKLVSAVVNTIYCTEVEAKPVDASTKKKKNKSASAPQQAKAIA